MFQNRIHSLDTSYNQTSALPLVLTTSHPICFLDLILTFSYLFKRLQMKRKTAFQQINANDWEEEWHESQWVRSVSVKCESTTTSVLFRSPPLIEVLMHVKINHKNLVLTLKCVLINLQRHFNTTKETRLLSYSSITITIATTITSSLRIPTPATAKEGNRWDCN